MTIFGVSVWIPLGLATLGLVARVFVAWLVQEWAPRQPHRRLDLDWPSELADGGRIAQRQREELLAGESALEGPAVIKSIKRARERGRLGRRVTR